MKNELTALDLKFLVKELAVLKGGIIQKVYQEGKRVRIMIYLPTQGERELFYEPNKIFITMYKRPAAEHPEAFGMLMRKHLTGQKIVDISQHNFDRILEMRTERNYVIFELFSKGNVILCDENKKIIMPLEVQLWRDRKVVPHVDYIYPPPVLNPFEISEYDLKRILSATDKALVKFLASNLSLSGLYAEEVCLRAGLDKNKPCNMLTEEEIKKIISAMQSLISESKPRIIENTDVVPFEMKIYANSSQVLFETYNEALDTFFTKSEEEKFKTEVEAKAEEFKEKIERKLTEQRATLDKYKRLEAESRNAAEAIMRNLELVQNIISGIQNARKNNISWEELKERIKLEETPEAQAIKEIREKDGVVVINIE